MKQILETATLNVELATATYGTSLPTIRVALPKGTPYRLVKAALHELAARAELATPPSERWCVEVERTGDLTGTVTLELIHGSESETARAMALLGEIAR